MNLIFSISISVFYLILVGCFNNKKSTDLGRPIFKDNNRTIDSLTKVYECESITFENWSVKKAEDSCLTICLNNSKKVPSTKDVDGNVAELKLIASSIKNSLARPESYKSYYIVFAEHNKDHLFETKALTLGMELPAE